MPFGLDQTMLPLSGPTPGSAPAAMLRPLREDIDIHPAPPREDGTPCWTLHDITAHRFFSVGLDELRILKYWGIGTAEQVAAAASTEALAPIPVHKVEDLANLLAQTQLLQASSARDTEYLLTLAQRREQSLLKKALHTYLSVRIPVLRPQRLLTALLPYTAWIFSPFFIVLSVLAAVCGAALVSVRWDEFTAFLPDMLTPSGIVAMFLALAVAKTLHEFGHAMTATRHGCRVSAMGVAIIVGCPMLYTDATEAWKLPKHSSRLRISLAGLGAEFMLASWALLFWNLVEPGHLRDALFLFSGVTWLVSLAINISPFMRFDGYYLLMDAWGIPNLQSRAFALATWKLRGLIFQIQQPCPDNINARTQRLMIIYAISTWLYRFFLFLGIAVLVYAFFFKVLGIFLMVVEIGWFIALPVWREMRAWHNLRQQARLRPGVVLLLTVLGGLILFMPWPRTLSLPAMLQLQNETHIYAPHGGKVVTFLVQIGDSVRAGQVLAQIHSPELKHELDLARLRLRTAEHRVNAASLGSTTSTELSILREDLRAARAAVRQREDDLARLQLIAPQAGQVVGVDDTVRPGTTVSQGQELVLMARPEAWEIHALAESEDFAHLTVNAVARFVPENPALPAVLCRVHRLDSYADRALDWPLLASAQGGQIETLPHAPLTMQTSRHRIVCLPDDKVAVQTRVRGMVTVRVWTEPLAKRAWTRGKVVWEREFGF